MASLTSCEKSHSPRRLPSVLRIRAGSVRQAGTWRAGCRFGDRIDAFGRQQPQPLAHQLGPALGRVPPLAHPLPGRAHRVVEVEVVAGAVAVAVERVVVALPDVERDRALARAAGRDLVDPQQTRPPPGPRSCRG